MKKILVCCAAGQATSAVIEIRIKELLEKNHIDYYIKRTTILEVDGILEDNPDFDLVVPSCTVNSHGIPMVSGIPYIIGFNTQDTDEKILEILKAKKEE